MAKPIIAEGTIADAEDGSSSIIYRGGKWYPYDESNPTSSPVSAGTKTDQEALQSLRDLSGKSLHTATEANRFVDLNRETGTGQMSARPVIPLTKALPGSPMWGDLTAALAGNPQWAQMKSITSMLAPAQRVPGSGSSSDLDIKMFKEAVPNIENTGPANEAIAKRLQKQSDHDAAYSAFSDTWFAKHGTLLGMPQAFNTFWAKREAGDPAANNVAPAKPVTQGQGWRIVP